MSGPDDRIHPHPAPMEDHHNPKIRVREDSVEMFRLLNACVLKALEEELGRRNIGPGARAAIAVDCATVSPSRVNLIFRIDLRGDGDTEIEFRGAC